MNRQFFNESWLSELETAHKITEVLLTSVFDRIEIKNHAYSPKNAHPLSAKTLQASSIVEENEMSGSKLADDLDWLKNGRLKTEAKTETFFYLLQKHGWRVTPPHQVSKTDIPLADHWRIKKALESPDVDGKYLLFKGDLSGIQEYIYHNIEHKRAGGLRGLARRLRGRSTTVALLSDFLANVYLRELGLPVFHLLFCGGGHFNLLIPADRKADVDNLNRQLNATMRYIFDGKLELLTAQVVCEKDIEKSAGAAFQQLSEQLEGKKYKAYSDRLGEIFFPKKTSEGVQGICEGETLGRRFPKMDFVVETISTETVDDSNGSFRVLWFSKKRGDAIHSLFIAEDFDAANSLMLKNKTKIQSASIFKINDTDFFPDDFEWAAEFDFPISFGFRFFGKNTPRKEATDDILDFKELAQPDSPPQNDRERNGKLAAMRLDVDDLGCIFSKGLKSNDSLERLATLSRELSYFFTAHFDELAREHNIYVIYSGGDDAFVVGRWDKLLQFARKLHETFQTFTGKNEDVHFSAGIYMGNPHFPVGRFYGEAERWQDEAKKREDKNRIAVFSHPLGWESFDTMLQHGTDLVKIMDSSKGENKPKFSSGLAYRLLQIVKTSFYEKTDIQKGEKRGHLNPKRFAENVGRLRYFFARQGFSKDKIKELEEGITRKLITVFLKAFDFKDDSKIARDYLVALNYALFQKKYNDNDNG